MLNSSIIYPLIVILVGNDGSMNHAVTVVDDLIFDSTQTYALKKTKESLDWICGAKGFRVMHHAYHFCRKYKSSKDQITRVPLKNWSVYYW